MTNVTGAAARAETVAREQMAELGRSLFERGLTHGSTGNLSVRLDDGWLLTPTDSCLGRLDPAAIARLDDAGTHLGGAKPSKELFLHEAVYQQRGAARAIVHLHSTWSVAVSCLPETDPGNALVPYTPYPLMKLGKVAVVPFYPPGDRRLAEAVREVSARHSAVLLANHGPVVAGASLTDAVYQAEELEASSKLQLLLRGADARTLGAADIEALAKR